MQANYKQNRYQIVRHRHELVYHDRFEASHCIVVDDKGVTKDADQVAHTEGQHDDHERVDAFLEVSLAHTAPMHHLAFF